MRAAAVAAAVWIASVSVTARARRSVSTAGPCSSSRGSPVKSNVPSGTAHTPPRPRPTPPRAARPPGRAHRSVPRVARPSPHHHDRHRAVVHDLHGDAALGEAGDAVAGVGAEDGPAAGPVLQVADDRVAAVA